MREYTSPPVNSMPWLPTNVRLPPDTTRMLTCGQPKMQDAFEEDDDPETHSMVMDWPLSIRMVGTSAVDGQELDRFPGQMQT